MEAMIINAEAYLNRSVKVFWEQDDAYYEGVVDEYHPERGLHVQYYDGDDEWVTTLDGLVFDAAGAMRAEHQMLADGDTDLLLQLVVSVEEDDFLYPLAVHTSPGCRHNRFIVWESHFLSL